MTERTLVLLRHAKSDWSGDEDDIDRPLAQRGRRQAPDAGRWLAAQLPDLDRALVSPARRARDTWDLVAAQLPSPPLTQVDDRIYAAWASELLTVVRDLPEDAARVVLVGHNPGLEDLAQLLSGTSVSMPTSALAVLTWAESWSLADRGAAVLRASGRPPGQLS